MAKHIIIGKGNLGLDLQSALDKAGHDARLFTRSGNGANGWEWPECAPMFLSEHKDTECVWVAAGGASVSHCEDVWSLPEATESLFELPVGLALELPARIRLVLFSTDYAIEEVDPAPARHTQAPRSIYAVIKIAMEQAIWSTRRPQTTIVRVGSLYGSHFPERTFPGKLAINNPHPGEVQVPRNFITPTPTWWIAEKMVASYEQLFGPFPRTEHLAPRKGCTLMEWAQAVLGPGYKVKSGPYDERRPRFSQIGMSFSSDSRTWLDLWREHLARWPEFPGYRIPRTQNTQE